MRSKGFTLVEILVVVVIMAIVISLAVLSIGVTGRDSQLDEESRRIEGLLGLLHERALLEAYRGGRMPHAWLIGGPPGIGKATLAYRMARFVLAHPDASAPQVQSARSLALPSDHRAVRLVAAQGHPDLLVLERRPGESGALRTVIAVEDVRRLVPFLGSTAGEAGWRVRKPSWKRITRVFARS